MDVISTASAIVSTSPIPVSTPVTADRVLELMNFWVQVVGAIFGALGVLIAFGLGILGFLVFNFVKQKDKADKEVEKIVNLTKQATDTVNKALLLVNTVKKKIDDADKLIKDIAKKAKELPSASPSPSFSPSASPSPSPSPEDSIDPMLISYEQSVDELEKKAKEFADLSGTIPVLTIPSSMGPDLVGPNDVILTFKSPPKNKKQS